MVVKSAILVLDMVNRFDFPAGGVLAGRAAGIATSIARLKARIKSTGGICVYVNDNFGAWQRDFPELVRQAADSRGVRAVKPLLPEPDDFFVLKPKHSGFFQTPLSTLLEKQEVGDLVVTGVATESCVLATALDAHMREYPVRAPSDCSASASPARKAAALLLMRHSSIDTRAASRG